MVRHPGSLLRAPFRLKPGKEKWPSSLLRAHLLLLVSKLYVIAVMQFVSHIFKKRVQCYISFSCTTGTILAGYWAHECNRHVTTRYYSIADCGGCCTLHPTTSSSRYWKPGPPAAATPLPIHPLSAPLATTSVFSVFTGLSLLLVCVLSEAGVRERQMP